VAKRLNEKLEDRVRQARRDIDQVIEQLKERADALLNTGVAGAAKSEARQAIDQIIDRLKEPAPPGGLPGPPPREAVVPVVGARVVVGPLGMEGTLVGIHGQQAEIDVRGKRLRAAMRDVRAIGAASASSPPPATVRVSVDLKPREGLLTELNVIGCTVDQAVDRVSRFFDQTMMTDIHEVRIVHGHGTGQLRKGLAAYLKTHPLVSKFYSAPQEQGGGGATIVELKE
jgi:DNA mismatch repair protein MutS2